MADVNTTKKILVAEDDKFYSAIYKKYLAFDNVEVFFANDGEEALKMAQEKKPDLILLDLIMPKMDGFDVLEKLKSDEELKAIKVVVLSNLGQEEDKKKALSMGASDYVVKSNISFDEITSVVQKYLG